MDDLASLIQQHQGTITATPEPSSAASGDLDALIAQHQGKETTPPPEEPKPFIANPIKATKSFIKDVQQTPDIFNQNVAEAERRSGFKEDPNRLEISGKPRLENLMIVPNLAGAAAKTLWQAPMVGAKAAYDAAKEYLPGPTQAATDYVKKSADYLANKEPWSQAAQQAGAGVSQAVQPVRDWLTKHPNVKNLVSDVANVAPAIPLSYAAPVAKAVGGAVEDVAGGAVGAGKAVVGAVGSQLEKTGLRTLGGELKIKESLAKSGYGRNMEEKKKVITKSVASLVSPVGNFDTAIQSANDRISVMQASREKQLDALSNKPDAVKVTPTDILSQTKGMAVPESIMTNIEKPGEELEGKPARKTKTVALGQFDKANSIIDGILTDAEKAGLNKPTTLKGLAGVLKVLDPDGRLFAKGAFISKDDALDDIIRKDMYFNILDEIEKHAPQVRTLGREEKKLIDAKSILTTAQSRIANRQGGSSTSFIDLIRSAGIGMGFGGLTHNTPEAVAAAIVAYGMQVAGRQGRFASTLIRTGRALKKIGGKEELPPPEPPPPAAPAPGSPKGPAPTEPPVPPTTGPGGDEAGYVQVPTLPKKPAGGGEAANIPPEDISANLALKEKYEKEAARIIEQQDWSPEEKMYAGVKNYIDNLKEKGYIYNRETKTYVPAQPADVEKYWSEFGSIGRTGTQPSDEYRAFTKSQAVERDQPPAEPSAAVEQPEPTVASPAAVPEQPAGVGGAGQPGLPGNAEPETPESPRVKIVGAREVSNAIDVNDYRDLAQHPNRKVVEKFDEVVLGHDLFRDIYTDPTLRRALGVDPLTGTVSKAAKEHFNEQMDILRGEKNGELDPEIEKRLTAKAEALNEAASDPNQEDTRSMRIFGREGQIHADDIRGIIAGAPRTYDWRSGNRVISKRAFDNYANRLRTEGGAAEQIEPDTRPVREPGEDEGEQLPPKAADKEIPKDENGEPMFQRRETQPVDKTLIALHNLNQSSIEFADRLGGLPVPSIAVTKAGMPFDRYGDVTLIAKKETIDPKYMKIFNADIYSGRSPSIEHDIQRPAAKDFRDKLWRARNKYQETTGEYDIESSINYPDKEKFINNAKDDVALKGMFLEENGVNVEPIKSQKKLIHEWAKEPEMIEWNKSVDWKRENEESGDSDYHKKIREDYNKAVDAAVRKKYTHEDVRDLSDKMVEREGKIILGRFIKK
jgi:hypothetical protein